MKPRKTTPNRKFLLRTPLVISFVVQIVTAVGLTGWLAFRNGQKTVPELVNQISERVTEQVEKDIKTVFAAWGLIRSFCNNNGLR